MSTENIPWIIKYRPRKLDDVVDQEDAKKELLDWLNSWEKKPPEKRAVLLNGPPGCGKTSLVEAIARTLGYEIFEMNASDSRRKQDIDRLMKTATQVSGLRARRKIILLDEVDGLSPVSDAGGIEAIVSIVKITKHPIIMTANNAYKEHLRPIRDVAKIIQMDRLKDQHVVFVLKRICQSEKLQCDQQALEEIAKRSEGDLRSAINDLEAIAAIDRKVTLDKVKAIATYRNRVYQPWEALRRLFMSKYVFQAKEAVSSTEMDPDEFKVWINEHIPSWFESMDEVAKAYDALSRADIYFGRVIKTQNWDLASYAIDLMGPGVAFSRSIYKGKFVAFKMPERIRLLSETKKSREYREILAEYLGGRLLTSKQTVKSDVIPYLRIIFDHNPEYAARLALAYSLPEELVTWLAGRRANEVLSNLKKLRK